MIPITTFKKGVAPCRSGFDRWMTVCSRFKIFAIALVALQMISFVGTNKIYAQPPCDLAVAVAPGDTVNITIFLNADGCAYLDGNVLFAAGIASGVGNTDCDVYRIFYNGLPVAQSLQDGAPCIPPPIALPANVVFPCSQVPCPGSNYDGTGKQYFQVALDNDCDPTSGQSPKIWIKVHVLDVTPPFIVECPDTAIRYLDENCADTVNYSAQFHDNCDIDSVFIWLKNQAGDVITTTNLGGADAMAFADGTDSLEIPLEGSATGCDTMYTVCSWAKDSVGLVSDTCYTKYTLRDTLKPLWNNSDILDTLMKYVPSADILNVPPPIGPSGNPLKGSIGTIRS